MHFFDFSLEKICTYQKFVVPLHAFSKVLSTRISVLHRILVPRSEVRLLGGQQGCDNKRPIFSAEAETCDGIHGIK